MTTSLRAQLATALSTLAAVRAERDRLARGLCPSVCPLDKRQRKTVGAIPCERRAPHAGYHEAGALAWADGDAMPRGLGDVAREERAAREAKAS